MKTIRCFRPNDSGRRYLAINDSIYWINCDGVNVSACNSQDEVAHDLLRQGFTEITASELAADFTGQPKTVAEIWRLVEEAEGCRCWVDADPFYRIYAGDKMVCFFADSHEFHHESPHVFTEECAIDCSYHRISLAEVLSAVNGNESLTKQIIEFVGEPVKEYATSFPTEFAECVTKALADESEEDHEYAFAVTDEVITDVANMTLTEAETFANGLVCGRRCDVDVYVKIGTIKYEGASHE